MFLPRRILTPRYPSVLPRARRSKCRTFRNGMEVRSPDETHDRDPLCPLDVCAVRRRRFPVGESPTRQPLQPEATGAVMEETKWLKPLV